LNYFNHFFVNYFFPIGVAFIHLLFDGTTTLAEVSTEYPSLGFTLAAVGTLIVLGLEQVAVMLISRIEVGSQEVMSTKDANKNDHENPKFGLEVVDSVQHTHESSCDHTHTIGLIAGSDSFSVLVKAYMV
jgi:hypothetical protein